MSPLTKTSTWKRRKALPGKLIFKRGIRDISWLTLIKAQRASIEDWLSKRDDSQTALHARDTNKKKNTRGCHNPACCGYWLDKFFRQILVVRQDCLSRESGRNSKQRLGWGEALGAGQSKLETLPIKNTYWMAWYCGLRVQVERERAREPRGLRSQFDIKIRDGIVREIELETIEGEI